MLLSFVVGYGCVCTRDTYKSLLEILINHYSIAIYITLDCFHVPSYNILIYYILSSL